MFTSQEAKSGHRKNNVDMNIKNLNFRRRNLFAHQTSMVSAILSK